MQVTVIYAVTMLLVEIGVAGLIGFITLIVSTPAFRPPRVLEATNLVAKKRSQSSSNVMMVAVWQVVFGFMSSVMKKIMEFEGKKMVESDKRIKLTGEVITVRFQTPGLTPPSQQLAHHSHTQPPTTKSLDPSVSRTTLSCASVTAHLMLRFPTCEGPATHLWHCSFQGINIIKFYTWEDAFTDAINAIRTQEIKWLREKAIVTIKMYAIMAAAPVACVLVSIGCYIWFGGTLTVVKLLTTLMLIVK